jgi:hypothetical protein
MARLNFADQYQQVTQKKSAPTNFPGLKDTLMAKSVLAVVALAVMRLPGSDNAAPF